MRGWLHFSFLLFLSFLRSKITIFFTFAFPLMFVFLYGYVFGGNDPEKMPFIAAQVFVMMVVANGLFGLGNLFLDLRIKGVLRRLYTAPVSKHLVLSAILTSWLLISSLTFALMFSVFKVVFKAEFSSSIFSLWLLYALSNFSIAGIAFVLASIVDRPEGLAMGANTLFFPMLFLSGLSFPSFILPESLQAMGKILPSYAMLQFFRSLTEGHPLGLVALVHSVTIALVGIGGYFAAIAVYRWDPEQKLSKNQSVQLVTALGILLVVPWAGISIAQSVSGIQRILSPRYVLKVASVFNGEKLIEFSPVYIGINNGHIEFVSSQIPVSWQRVQIKDFSNSWAIPGLIDMHVHLDYPVIPLFSPDFSNMDIIKHNLLKGYLASGVTTVRSLGDYHKPLKELQRISEAGVREYPRLYLSGPLFTAPGGYPLELPIYVIYPDEFKKKRVIEVESPEDAEDKIRSFLKNFRPDWLKVIYGSTVSYPTYPKISKETLKKLVSEAHREGLRVTVHVSKVEELKDVLEANVDMVEHIPYDRIIDTELALAMKEKGIAISSTIFSIENYKHLLFQENVIDDFALARLFKPIKEALLSRRSNWIKMIPQEFREFVLNYYTSKVQSSLDTLYKNVRLLSQLGVKIVAGSDAANNRVYHGSGLISELESLEKAGISPLYVLKTATSQAGETLKVKIGKLQKDYYADIVLTSKNPLEDISNLRTLHTVVYNGRIYKVEDLLN